MNTPDARRRRWLRAVAAILLLLAGGASIRQERREYRDDGGNVTGTRSAVLLPWQRLPPIPGDRPGSVTSRASLAFGLLPRNPARAGPQESLTS